MSAFTRTIAAALCAVALPLQAAFSQVTAAEQAPTALTNLVKEALDASPEPARARAAVEAARARHRAAGRPLYNPELAIEAERSDVNTTTAGVQQTIDWSGKREGRSAVAAAELLSSEAALSEIRLSVATRVLSALADYQIAQSIAALARQRVELMQRFADLAARRQQAGDLELVDLDLARLALAQAQLQQAEARAAVAESEEALVALFGTSRPWPELPAGLPAPDIVGPDMVRGLPQVRAAEAEVDAARERAGLRRLERRPDPTVGVRAGREDAESLVGLSVSIPLFVRNSYRAEVQAAEAELTEAQQAAQVLVQQLKARQATAQRRYRAAFEAWRQWQGAGSEALARQGELLERLWRAGEIGAADYLVQLRQALDTREAAVMHYGRAWRAWFQWLEATGRTFAWARLDENDFEAN